MAGQLGKFQMQSFNGWKGLTKLNHLASIQAIAPQKASDVMVQLLAFNYRPTLDTLLSQFPTKEFDTDDEYYWDVIGCAKKNVPLVQARDVAGVVVTATSPNVGVGTEPFYLVFAEDYFANGEVIFGNLNQVYPIRILGNPVEEGTNYRYKVELMGGITTGIPAERLLAGERFSVGFAPAERELSRKMGDIRFSTPISMRNEWTTIRIQHKVTGAMLDRKLAVGIPMKDPNGKSIIANKWMHYVDWVLEKQWNDYKNTVMAWGTSNRNSNGEYLNIGQSGEAIRMGSGLFEQMEAGNTVYYNDFSLKLIEDALYQLSAAKLDYSQRKFILRTGEYGAAQFHKAVLNTMSGWTQFTFDGTNVGVIEKTQNKMHSNALSAGFQFTQFKAPNGVIITVDVDSFYDDPVQNKVMHPNGGVAMSYRYDIMDIGNSDQPNIIKCAIKGRPEIRGIEPGLRDPYTNNYNVQYMSHDEDSSTIHKMTTLGIAVLDPTRTMSIIPSILMG